MHSTYHVSLSNCDIPPIPHTPITPRTPQVQKIKQLKKLICFYIAYFYIDKLILNLIQVTFPHTRMPPGHLRIPIAHKPKKSAKK